MNAQPIPAVPYYPPPSLMLAPLAHWYAGFDYAFGYQLKLVWDFWGLSDD